MGLIQCVACRVEVDEFDTYISDAGTVCADCHTLEESRDRAEFHRGSDGNRTPYTLSDIIEKMTGKFEDGS